VAHREAVRGPWNESGSLVPKECKRMMYRGDLKVKMERLEVSHLCCPLERRRSGPRDWWSLERQWRQTCSWRSLLAQSSEESRDWGERVS
jgi:hypothetical protein